MSGSYVSALLARPGAVPMSADTAVDVSGVAWHYGDPLGEQAAAHTGLAVVDRSHRGVLRVSGDDAATFLNTLLSQKLDDAAVGFAGGALDLDVQGHILHQIDVLRADDAFYLDVPSYQIDSLTEFLSRMVFWSKVEISRADLAVLTVLGDGELTVDTAVRNVELSSPEAARRRDLLVARTGLTDAVDALLADGARLAGLHAFTAERVRAGTPEARADLDDKSIPHEVPGFIGRGERVGSVHLVKGCYRGQETVARVENLGRSPRLLVRLHLDGSAPVDPTPGMEVRSGSRKVGRLGSVVHDYEYGLSALALVKRSALSAQLEVGESVAAQVDPGSLPAGDEAKAGRDAINRLRSGQGPTTPRKP
ncbi:CAF17-like 4Fe-4S cluster assembly/insertion protein YgfZ [Corynebacterium uterequi]|nr:folate-binding protein YgfZ [Corynebacterium uterequi]